MSKVSDSTGRVVSVNVSAEKGAVKHPVEEVLVTDRGIEGDTHAGPWHRQVSILSQEQIDRFSERNGRPVAAGEFAENITISGQVSAFLKREDAK